MQFNPRLLTAALVGNTTGSTAGGCARDRQSVGDDDDEPRPSLGEQPRRFQRGKKILKNKTKRSMH